MKKILRIGVVGLGNMGRHHVKHLADMPGVLLVGVCDQNLDSVTHFSGLYSCAGYTHVTDLISEQTPDALVIITPTTFHYSIAQEALAAGCHVFVEKPITTSLAQADTLIAIAERRQLVFAVGHIERFNPSVLAAQSLIQTGKLGALIALETYRVSPMPSQIKDDDVLMDLGIHDIDLCNAFMADTPTLLTCHKFSKQLTDRADIAQILLHYTKGFATIHVSWLSPLRRRGFRLTCENGYLEADTITHTLTYWTADHPTPHVHPVAPHDALYAELLDFVTAIKQNTLPKNTGHSARSALSLVLTAIG